MQKAISSLKDVLVKIKVYSTQSRKEKLRTQRKYFQLVKRIVAVQVCDARDDDRSIAVQDIKVANSLIIISKCQVKDEI